MRKFHPGVSDAHMTKQTPQEEAARAQHQIWTLADEIRRSKGHLDPAALATAAIKKGMQWEDIFSAFSHAFSKSFGELWVPPYISKFIAAYLKGKQIRRALDLHAGLGSLLSPVVRACGIEEGVGIVRTEDELKMARAMSWGLPITWVQGDPQRVLGEHGQFDLVVSSPSLGLPPTSEDIPADGVAIKLHDSMTNLLVLKSCQHLESEGDGIFLLPNAFLRSQVAVHLSRFGLFMNTIVALPERAFAPFTGIDLNLIFLSRHSTENWFVGQLDPGRDPEALIKNLRARIAGRAPELGRLVAPEKFVSWRALVTSEEIERLVQRGGLQPTPLAQITEAINLGERSEDGGFADLPNAVYLPLIGTSAAVTSLSGLQIKAQNCAQLVLQPEKAFAEFLAGFFNSSLGRKVRDQLLSGTFIPKITKQNLMQAIVYLPPIETQNKTVDVHREIRELTLRLVELQQCLWNRPSDASKVRKAIASIGQKDSFESWLETLPFPLASILWRYQATNAVDEKNTHLLNFFEAAAQFFATLIVSAFHSSEQFFQENKRSWFETGDGVHSLAKSNFGEWVVRGQRLAKTTREMLSGKARRNFCLDLFGTQNPENIEAVANKELHRLFGVANEYRKDWKAHGGIVGQGEHARRLTLLQSELTRMREVLGSIFEDWWLLRPGKSEYSKGVYHFSTAKLMGSRQIFKEAVIETPTVMDKNELYLFDFTTRHPLQLLPFFRILPGPRTEENACYFYNRVQTDGVRWVSYHFEQESELVRSDDALIKVIGEIEKDDL